MDGIVEGGAPPRALRLRVVERGRGGGSWAAEIVAAAWVETAKAKGEKVGGSESNSEVLRIIRKASQKVQSRITPWDYYMKEKNIVSHMRQGSTSRIFSDEIFLKIRSSSNFLDDEYIWDVERMIIWKFGVFLFGKSFSPMYCVPNMLVSEHIYPRSPNQWT